MEGRACCTQVLRVVQHQPLYGEPSLDLCPGIVYAAVLYFPFISMAFWVKFMRCVIQKGARCHVLLLGLAHGALARRSVMAVFWRPGCCFDRRGDTLGCVADVGMVVFTVLA